MVRGTDAVARGALPRAVTMYNHAGPSTIPDRAHPPGRPAGAYRLRAWAWWPAA
ncbi:MULTISPECIES: hypothetical protein [unclassified Micromonospora]|uniref:hypothetical protein n=1 Tax=unclassified Micromonospora TaxID=2617518 RepID=UPI003A8A9321